MTSESASPGFTHTTSTNDSPPCSHDRRRDSLQSASSPLTTPRLAGATLLVPAACHNGRGAALLTSFDGSLSDASFNLLPGAATCRMSQEERVQLAAPQSTARDGKPLTCTLPPVKTRPVVVTNLSISEEGLDTIEDSKGPNRVMKIEDTDSADRSFELSPLPLRGRAGDPPVRQHHLPRGLPSPTSTGPTVTEQYSATFTAKPILSNVVPPSKKPVSKPTAPQGGRRSPQHQQQQLQQPLNPLLAAMLLGDKVSSPAHQRLVDATPSPAAGSRAGTPSATPRGGAAARPDGLVNGVLHRRPRGETPTASRPSSVASRRNGVSPSPPRSVGGSAQQHHPKGQEEGSSAMPTLNKLLRTTTRSSGAETKTNGGADAVAADEPQDDRPPPMTGADKDFGGECEDLPVMNETTKIGPPPSGTPSSRGRGMAGVVKAVAAMVKLRTPRRQAGGDDGDISQGTSSAAAGATMLQPRKPAMSSRNLKPRTLGRGNHA